MPNKNSFAPLTEPQLKVMRAIWARNEATVAEVWDELRAERPIARNTVLTVMDRLEKKGWLRRRAEGVRHYYSAARSREETLGSMVGRLVETAFEGSAEELVVALLNSRGVSPAEAKRIRKLIDAARRNEQ